MKNPNQGRGSDLDRIEGEGAPVRDADGTVVAAVPMHGQPLGIRWCRAHHGVLNDDDDVCDIARLGFVEADQDDECDVADAWVDVEGGAA